MTKEIKRAPRQKTAVRLPWGRIRIPRQAIAVGVAAVTVTGTGTALAASFGETALPQTASLQDAHITIPAAHHKHTSRPAETSRSFVRAKLPTAKPTPKPAPKVTPTRSAAPVTPPAPSGTPQEIAQQMMASRGWGGDQFSCLDALWNRESGWNMYASNPSSGAYGIPQALPASKMGPGWQNNASVQISWGLGYIAERYGNPCGAWGHSQATGWY